MNDWIILGIFIIAIAEVIFIFSRVKRPKEYWVAQKALSLVGAVLVGTFHLFFLTENTPVGEPIIFYWHRLTYELYFLLAITLVFTINYFVTKIMNKFVNQKGDEQ